MVASTRIHPRQRVLVVSSVVLGCLLVSTAVASLSGRSARQHGGMPIIKDKTGSLRFVSIEKVDWLFVVRMENTSKKAISAYVVAVCGAPEHSADYTLGDHLIEPGENAEVKVAVQAVSDKCGYAITQPTISILSVVFDDRSFEGESQWAIGILEQRRGQKIQLERINRALKDALKRPDAPDRSVLQTLQVYIGSLPIDEQEPPAVRSGLAAARDSAMYMLTEIEQWHESRVGSSSKSVALRGELVGANNLREALERLTRLNEKWITRY